MKICINCKKKLTELIDNDYPKLTYLYCNNIDCPRLGLLTVLFEEKEEQVEKKPDLLPNLSDKEKQLFDFIDCSNEKVTVQIIEEKLSKGHIGAIGKLLGAGLIEKKKDRSEASHGKKAVTYYAVKEKNE